MYESTESELLDLVKAKRIAVERKHVDQLDSIHIKSQSIGEHWWCVDGSMIINAENNNTLTIQAGDKAYIPAQSQFSLVAGLNGCTYYVSS